MTKKHLLYAIPMMAALLAPDLAEARPFCRDYERTVYYAGGYSETEYGTACARGGGWEYFPGQRPYGVVRNVQYFDSPVRYYQPAPQRSNFFLSLNLSENDRKHYGRRDHHWHGHDRGRGHGHHGRGHDRHR